MLCAWVGMSWGGGGGGKGVGASPNPPPTPAAPTLPPSHLHTVRQNVTSTLMSPPLAAVAGTTLPSSCLPSTPTVRSPVRVMWMR